ncbi:MAG: SDR family oxidoreductase [Deltaproteobacteria bacterium]|nr:SDR family oxidoreductase [Deltaproteobacteria bacterium]
MRTNSLPRVLITGGAGFIGSHLCERFLERNFEVICLDNFFTGSRLNLSHLKDHPHFELVRHDVVEPLAIESEYILNFACPASPVHYQYDPVMTMRISVEGTLNLLNLARRTGATFVQASTSEVYGDPEEHPQKESYRGCVNPTGTRACYDEGKRAAESLCFDFRRSYQTDVRVIRIFNTYGPRMACNDGRVVSNFITQAISGRPLTIYGDGSQTRSFCYVQDLVDGIERITMADKNLFSSPYNLGNDGEFTVRELAEKVIRLSESASAIEYKDLPQDDPVRRRPDLSRMRQAFDWNPAVPLEKGLIESISWYRKLLETNPALFHQ